MGPNDIVYLNEKGEEVHRVVSEEVNKVYLIKDDNGVFGAKSLTTRMIQSTKTVAAAQAVNSLLSSKLLEPDNMSMSFTGSATATGGSDKEGRDKYTASGNLSVKVGFKSINNGSNNGVEAEIMNVSAISGPWDYGPIPNGNYSGTGITNTSESGMVRDGVGFKVFLSDNSELNRTQLRIHPDQVPSVGTAGCIGIAENSESLKKLRGHIRSYFSSSNNNISLSVNITNNPNYSRPLSGSANSGE
jgi:hypothetical protein